jgi:hypothetical protein
MNTASSAPAMLAQQFHRDGALPGDHGRIVVGMHEAQAALDGDAFADSRSSIIAVALENDLGAVSGNGIDLDRRRGAGHHDGRFAAEFTRRERHALGVVACRHRQYAGRALGLAQSGHLVVGAAQFEGKHRLQVFALEQHAMANTSRQSSCFGQWRLDRHLVDARSQHGAQVIGHRIRHEVLRSPMLHRNRKAVQAGHRKPRA